LTYLKKREQLTNTQFLVLGDFELLAFDHQDRETIAAFKYADKHFRWVELGAG
jgi:hypothetical protein